jgi:hypothetical protein
MTPDQLLREQAAAHSLAERMGAAIQHGVFAAIQDIRRRVIEEPWFGRTVNDILAERLRGTEAFYASGKEVWEAVAGTGEARTPEQPRELQDIEAHLFGPPSPPAPGQDQGRSQGQGMEP